MPNRQQVLQFLATFFNGAVLGVLLWLLFAQLGIPMLLGHLTFDPFKWAALFGGIIAVIKLRKVLWAGIIISLVLIVLISYTPVMSPAIRSTIRQDSLKSQYDAVVALSAGANADGILNDQGTDRILTALNMAKHGATKNLIMTQFRANYGELVITPEKDQAWFVDMVFHNENPPHVFAAQNVVNTHDEALRVRELAKANGWKSIAVVTSPLHTRRACATFEKAAGTDVKITCVPSRSISPAVKKLVSSADRLATFQIWLYERIGYLEYWRRGWV